MGKLKKGDYFKIVSDNENYDKHRKRVWQVSHVSRSVDDHPGYDEGIGGDLYDAYGLPFSLYEWEVRKISKRRR